MRILNLTDAVAAKFLKRRGAHDAGAEHIAARILTDVRKNGDAALFRWALRLDGLRLTRKSLWITRAEIRTAGRDVPRELLGAIEHAARNIRRVADEQRPRSWTITVEPGVRIGQRVTPLGTIVSLCFRLC
jgi:histidinol dehydrogenase